MLASSRGSDEDGKPMIKNYAAADCVIVINLSGAYQQVKEEL